jgi:hypothetical protein
MAPSTRNKTTSDAEKLAAVLKSSPAKVKAANKRKEAERRAEEAAIKKAEKQKSMKKKSSDATVKTLADTDKADYSMYDKETELLLTKSDLELQQNASKFVYYSNLLSSMNQKEWPESAVATRKKIKQYSAQVDTIRKAKDALLKSSKPSKGKKKEGAFDPSSFISSGEYDPLCSSPHRRQRSFYIPSLCIPSAIGSHSLLNYHIYLFLWNFLSFIHCLRAATACSASCLSPSAFCLIPGCTPIFGFVPFPSTASCLSHCINYMPLWHLSHRVLSSTTHEYTGPHSMPMHPPSPCTCTSAAHNVHRRQ